MKLYRFPYSPYAHKVQVVLDLTGMRYSIVDVAYCDRAELVAATGGYVHVPVLVDDDGSAVFDSRRIVERLIARAGAGLVPAPWDGPIWAYSDWVDGPLEEALFPLAAPAVRDRWPTAAERAMYVLIKERKFGRGCVDAWARAREELKERARTLLAPSARTLAARPFLFGDRPTLADAALYGQFAMLAADDTLAPDWFGDSFPPWIERLNGTRRG